MKQEEVDYMFGGLNEVSSDFRIILAKAISKLPNDIVEWVTDKLMFVSNSEKYWAFSLSKKEWSYKLGFIFLCDDLKNLSEEKQAFIIAHEIAYQKLNHKSPILSNLTNKETQNQEVEADSLARKWLRKETKES